MNEISQAIVQNDARALKKAVQDYARTNQPSSEGMWHGPGIPADQSGTLRCDVHDHNPNWLGTLYYNIGNDCQRAAKHDLAVAMYTEALNAGYDSPSVHNNIAASSKRLGHYTTARDIYYMLIETHPEYLPAFARLAIMLEAYNIPSTFSPEHFMGEYLRRGGNTAQARAFVALPVEATALDAILSRL